MHELTLELNDDAFQRIKTELCFKKMCGNIHGSPDELVMMIIRAIDKGEKTISIETKENTRAPGTPAQKPQ